MFPAPTTRPRVNAPASQYDAPSGTLSSPSSKVLFGLLAPVRWWCDSTAQLVVSECCRFPLRIVAALQRQHLPQRAIQLPDSEGCIPATFYEECTYLLESSEGILGLLRQHRWAGKLDRRIAIESFQLGAEYMLNTRCKPQPSDTQAGKK